MNGKFVEFDDNVLNVFMNVKFHTYCNLIGQFEVIKYDWRLFD